ncbi:protein-L-isoaspartate(D-aspartate) O-methyltransferase [Denitrobaculum tricleocarpae]|nr:protein-L-isoaspartate(D-aspartate) O-methyltransferase [Denitrobaculum tricleocarpae]
MQESREDRIEERRAMLREVAADVSATAGHLGRAALSPEVVAALEKVPRHCFLPPESQHLAYENRPQRIGHGQTISQPFIVAIMSDLAAVKPGDKVLEIGTGCGYQSAVLAELGAEVYSLERIARLAETARERLNGLGYGEAVHIRAGDGALGWPEHAPYDSIVVTATTNAHVVAELLKQLAPGGRMVVPQVIGEDAGGGVDAEKAKEKTGEKTTDKAPSLAGILPFRRRLFVEPDTDLCLITKDSDGACSTERLLPVAFVPLVEGKPED